MCFFIAAITHGAPTMTRQIVERRDSLGKVLAIETWDFERKTMVSYNGKTTERYAIKVDEKTWKTSLQEIKS
jgi:hypothetical protein